MNVNKKYPKVSIIIPCKEIDDYTKECIAYCKELDYPNYEIIVLPDYTNKNNNVNGNIIIIPTGEVPPGKKRNIGIEKSTGELLAFIDNDAYPRKDWLKNAIKYFRDKNVAAIGGPGITPENDNIYQKASGYALSSFLVGVGKLRNRFKSINSYESDDVHSCNFIARKDIFKKIRWNEKYWPGEDTLLCLDIKKLGFKMLEVPDVVVYHHRRSLFIPYIRQIFNYALHRGYFIRKFPENSKKIIYFIPSIFVLYLIFGIIVSIFNSTFRFVYIMSLGIYLILVIVGSLHAKNLKTIFLTWIAIIITHITYGIGFLKGLLSRRLER